MKCSLCQNDNLSIIYTVSNLPVFQNKVYATVSKAQNIITGNVELVMCSNCGFIFNAAFDKKAMGYDAHYQNEQAHSPYFQTAGKDILGSLLSCLQKKDFQK
jgi:hypothetical protein